MSEGEGRTKLALRFLQKAPERGARVLESHAPEDGTKLLEKLDADVASSVLCGMLPRHAAAQLALLDLDVSAKWLRHIDDVDAAPILRALDHRRRAALLRRLPSRRAVSLNWLLSHPDDSVGAWTDTAAFTLSMDFSVQEALAQIRDADSAPTETLYVLGKKGRLMGVVTTTTLLRATHKALISNLCRKPAPPLSAQASLNSVAHLQGWRLHNALPVIDRNQKFVGVLERDGLERGLMHGTGEDQAGNFASALMEASQAYWAGMSALWQTTFGLLTTPISRAGKAPERQV